MGVNFSKVSRKSFLGKVLRLLIQIIPKRAVLPILQGPIRGMKWIVGAGTYGEWLGSYEYEKSRIFSESVKPEDVVLDVGANAGYFTLTASKFVKETGHVYAFEPSPRNGRFLKRHLVLNQIKQVTFFEKAVGLKAEIAYFADSSNSFSGCLAAQGETKVEVVVLDDLWRNGEIKAPQVIKMDIEGGEYDALQGARELISRCRPLIVLATHGEKVHKQCCEFLENLGYTMRPISTPDELLCIYDSK